MRIQAEEVANERQITVIDKVGTSWTAVVEAPDFSVPDPGGDYVEDPADSSRGLRAGEVFVPRPLIAYNTDSSPVTLEVRLSFEDDSSTNLFTLTIPAGDSAEIRLQGATFTKRDFTASNGERVEVRASAGSVLILTAWYSTRLATDHEDV
jgi:hypothetical protein